MCRSTQSGRIVAPPARALPRLHQTTRMVVVVVGEDTAVTPPPPAAVPSALTHPTVAASLPRRTDRHLSVALDRREVEGAMNRRRRWDIRVRRPRLFHMGLGFHRRRLRGSLMRLRRVGVVGGGRLIRGMDRECRRRGRGGILTRGKTCKLWLVADDLGRGLLMRYL